MSETRDLAALHISVEERVDPREIAALEERIRLETMARSGRADARDIAAFVRRGGAVQAGAYGVTWGGACELQYLWVEPALRGQGTGARLLELVERAAAQRGCRQIMAFTHALQAPGFYERQGYTLAGRVEDYPVGDAALWFVKRL